MTDILRSNTDSIVKMMLEWETGQPLLLGKYLCPATIPVKYFCIKLIDKI